MSFVRKSLVFQRPWCSGNIAPFQGVAPDSISGGRKNSKEFKEHSSELVFERIRAYLSEWSKEPC